MDINEKPFILNFEDHYHETNNENNENSNLEHQLLGIQSNNCDERSRDSSVFNHAENYDHLSNVGINTNAHLIQEEIENESNANNEQDISHTMSKDTIMLLEAKNSNDFINEINANENKLTLSNSSDSLPRGKVKESSGENGDSVSDEDEGGILNLLFRRSTWRKSRRQVRPSQTTQTHSDPVNDAIATLSSAIDANEREIQPGGTRKSLRRFFKRNDSFYRAQKNSIHHREQNSQSIENQIFDNNNSQTNSEDLDPLHYSNLNYMRENLYPTVTSSTEFENTDPSQTDENPLQRNETRRSVRFTIGPTDSADSPTLSEHLNNGASNTERQDQIIRSLLPPPLGTRQTRSSIRNQNARNNSSDHQNDASSAEDIYQQERLAAVIESDEDRGKRNGFWPHLPCSMLAAMACTLGMGSICRFAFLSFQYGGAFILQFIMLSITFGFPMVSFFMTLGQYMGCGIMGMWKISPVFQGIGVASLVATALIGIYSIVPVSWFFIYFRDSFITDGPGFKWGECTITMGRYYSSCTNQTFSEIYRNSVPQYLNTRVLQRSIQHPFVSTFGELKFENVFNLAVVWMLVFICLSKGLRSYGKVVFVFALFPLIGFLILAVELLRQAQGGTEHILKMNTVMYDVFMSGSSWVAAAREVFFVWGINGAVLMQLTSHNRFRHNIRRDSSIVILITITTLMVAAFLGCACFSIIFRYERGRVKYVPSSFETVRSMVFLSPNPTTSPPVRHQWSNNFLLGEEMININTDLKQQSNYQVFRLVTELFPSAVANLGGNNISPFWSVLLYLTLITFGISQQLAIWRCVIEGIIAVKPSVLRSWETTITFISCIMGFALGLPFTTEIGIFALYFMDFCVGSAWWIMLIYVCQILALFIVRGKPYSADDLVTLITPDKFSKKWLSNLIAFSWNVITPTGLLVLAITSFQNGMFNRLYRWFDSKGYVFWPIWVRQLGTFIQLIPLFIIPFFGLIQTCRYLAKGPQDLFDRLQMLYRPSIRTPPDGQQAIYSDITGHSDGIENPGFSEDPPPKYTPPPSYNTATGLKLLKRLNSLRRSFRSFQSSNRQQAISNMTDAETAVGAANEACCSRTLNVPFFISPQDLHTASTSGQSSNPES